MHFRRGTLVILTTVAVAMAQETPSVGSRELARQVLASEGCQSELPSDPGGASAGASHGRGQANGRDRRGSTRSSSGWGGLHMGGLDGLGVPLLVVILSVAVVGLVVAIVRALQPSAARPRVPKGAPRTSRPIAPGPEVSPFPDHAVLAAAGDFAGAVHAVLLRAFGAFAAR